MTRWSPEGTVEILAGTPEGGGQDRVARAMATSLPFDCEVVNLPGRGGGNAWDALASTPGDSRRVAVSSPTLITNSLLGEAGIDHHDLSPLATLCTEHIVFAVSADSDIASPVTLLERLPGDGLTTAIATAAGNINHMALAMVGHHVGTDPASLPVRVFDSARLAIADLLDGSSDMAAVSAASVLPEVESGAVRPLAVSSGERLGPPFDSVPTWTELRVPCLIGTWRGVVGPAGLSDNDMAGWESELAEMTRTATWQRLLIEHRWVPDHRGRAATVSFLDEQREAMVEMLAELGLRRHEG